MEKQKFSVFNYRSLEILQIPVEQFLLVGDLLVEQILPVGRIHPAVNLLVYRTLHAGILADQILLGGDRNLLILGVIHRCFRHQYQ